MATLTVPRAPGGTLIITYIPSGGGGTTLSNVTPNLTMYVRSGAIGIGSTPVPGAALDYSPIYVGDTGAFLAPQFVHKGTNTAFDLTGATFTARMTNQYGVTKVLSGSWVISASALGTAYYIFQSADVDTSGRMEDTGKYHGIR